MVADRDLRFGTIERQLRRAAVFLGCENCDEFVTVAAEFVADLNAITTRTPHSGLRSCSW
jgi:hypothetical protein